METVLSIEDELMQKAKAEALRQGCTLSEVVESALRMSLHKVEPIDDHCPLPSFNSGGQLVDIADRTELYKAIERNGVRCRHKHPGVCR